MTNQIEWLRKILSCLLLCFLPQLSHAQELLFQDVLLDEDIMNIKNVSFEHESTGILSEQRGALYLPLPPKGNKSFMAFTRGQRVRMDEEQKIFDRNLTLPQEFGSAELGLGSRMTNDEGNRYGLTASFGSAGRQLLVNSYSPTFMGTASLEKRRPDGRSWLFYVIGASHGDRGGVVPGVGYVMRGPNYRFIFGLPLLVMVWNPNPVNLMVMATPFSLHTEASYSIKQDLNVFSEFNWDSKEHYNLVNNSTDSLFIQGKKISGGIKYTYDKSTECLLGYSYSFDRQLFIAHSSSEGKSNPVAFADAGGIQFKASFKF